MEVRRGCTIVFLSRDFLILYQLVCDTLSSAISVPTTFVTVIMRGHGDKQEPNVLWKFSISKELVQRMKKELCRFLNEHTLNSSNSNNNNNL